MKIEESLWQDIADAQKRLVKRYGKEIEPAIGEWMKQHPKSNIFFSEDGFNEFLDWAKKNYNIVDSEEEPTDFLGECDNMKKTLTEASDSVEFQAFITNLGKYNDGELVGEWVSFPIDSSEFDSVIEKIGCNEPGYEEWFVTDYDCDCDAYGVLGEYPSLDELNEFGEMIDDDAFKAILEDQGNFEYAKKVYESGDYVFYPGITDETDLAYEEVEMLGGVENMTQNEIEDYFDYEQFGRDLSFEHYEDDEGNEMTAGEYWCGDENASDYDIGEAYVDEVGFAGVANPESYFDYSKYGRDLGYTITDYGAILVY